MQQPIHLPTYVYLSIRCLENVAKRYRAEQWWELLSDVLVDLLECAKKTQNATDIVNYSLELMSKRTRLS